jgi:hypothetical protein
MTHWSNSIFKGVINNHSGGRRKRSYCKKASRVGDIAVGTLKTCKLPQKGWKADVMAE